MAGPFSSSAFTPPGVSLPPEQELLSAEPQFTPVPQAPIDDSQVRTDADGKKFYVPSEPYVNVPDNAGAQGEALSGAAAAKDIDNVIWGLAPPRAPNVGVQPKHNDLTSIGGPGPLADEMAQKSQQAQLAQEMGEDQSSSHKKLEGLYSGENSRQATDAANWKVQAAEDQAFFLQRAQEIDKVSNQIASHRQDTGRFWKNPGNIIAAIGAALVGLGSPDSTVGVRLINSAVQNDLELQRQDHHMMMADKLGLEDNVNLYRKLVGDRQAGDMVHEAKLRQAAAMKVEEIASQLRSEEAKKAGLMYASNLRESADKIFMGAMQMTYHAPAIQNKALIDAQMGYGSVVRAPKMGSPQAGPASPAQGPNASGPPAQGASSPSGRAPQGNSDPLAQDPRNQRAIQTLRGGPQMQGTRSPESVVRTDPAEEAAAKRVEERIGVPGSWKHVKRMAAEKRSIAERLHPMDPKAQNAWLVADREKSYKAVAEKSKDLSELTNKSVAFSDIQRTNEEFKASFTNARGETDYAAIDAVLGQDWKFMTSPGAVEKYRTLRSVMTSSGQPLELSERQRTAAARYASKLQMAINSYGKDTFGGAITNQSSSGGQSESQRLDQVISQTKSFKLIDGWVNQMSRNYGGQWMNGMAGLPLDGQLLYAAQRGIRLPTVPNEGR